MQVGNVKGEPFETNIGTPQGDCESALEFTFKLAVALTLQIPDAVKLPDQTKRNHNKDKEHFSIYFQYAEDIGNAITDKQHKDNIRKKLPFNAKQRNLNINTEKNKNFM